MRILNDFYMYFMHINVSGGSVLLFDKLMSSSSPGGDTGGKYAVYDCGLELPSSSNAILSVGSMMLGEVCGGVTEAQWTTDGG